MLYKPAPIDFTSNILVFIHVPKTAGSSLAHALIQAVGKEAHLLTYLEKLGKIHVSRVHKAAWTARRYARDSLLRLRGLHPLIRKEDRKRDLASLRVLHGHVSLGNEPQTGRNPLYISIARDPVERFVSDYYYRYDIRSTWPAGKRERSKFWLYDIDRFVDFVYDRRSWTETNQQCRFLGGAESFEAASKAIDERVFLAAPVHRMQEFLELMEPVMGLKSASAPHVNSGKARQGKAPPSEKSIAKIREMVSEDLRLVDYVSKAFDDVYARYGQQVQSA
jgi:hypothetical protein